jgi:hypothetical protein
MQPERSQVSLFEIELEEVQRDLRDLQLVEESLGEEPEEGVGESPSASQDR